MKKFYAATISRYPGVYNNWSDCEKGIKGYHSPDHKQTDHKGFSTLIEALDYYQKQGGDLNLLSPEYRKIIEHTDNIIDVATFAQQNDFSDDKSTMHYQKLSAKMKKVAQNIEPLTDELKAFCDKYGYEHLNHAQKAAIQTITGKSLLFAVPGSGKTTVLIARTGYMLHGQKSVSITPDMLMNLTFTRAAAKEMADRYISKFPDDMGKALPAFKTIHSFCISEIIPLLRERNFPMPQLVIDTDKQRNQEEMSKDTSDGDHDYNSMADTEKESVSSYAILKAVLMHFKLSRRDESINEKISGVITSIKNRQLQPREYEGKVIVIDKQEYEVKEIFDTYQKELGKHCCMDYDDMLCYSLSGLKQYPNILRKLQNKYLYWSIDETQDNSQLQNELLSLLVGAQGNLFVVGDDDQSIYYFRGAEPRLLLDYGLQDNVKIMVMGTNYRSGSYIVNIAKSFIEENNCRADKQMKPAADAELGKINFYANLSTEQHQYQYIVEAAKNSQAKEQSLAVIYRLNASSFPLMFWLKKQGIKFNVTKDYQEIACSKVFSDIINIMTLALHPDDWEAFLRCRFALNIFLENDSIKSMEEKLKNGGRVISVLDWIAVKQPNISSYVQNAKDVLHHIRNMTAFEAAKFLLEKLENINKNGRKSAPGRLREYAVLAACIPFPRIEDFLTAHYELLQETKNDSLRDNHITLTSMHSAKGLEFDHVIIIDAWKEIMERQDGVMEDELYFYDDEENRRLFYVAMTRAKKILDIYIPEKYFGKDENVSNFINDVARLCEAYRQCPPSLLPEINMKTAQSQYRYDQPHKYYGVRKGYKTGVFDNWDEVEKIVSGYSGADQKGFETFVEAKDYVRGYVDDAYLLEYHNLAYNMHNIQPGAYMMALDLPMQLNRAILGWFKVPSLLDLSPVRVEAIKENDVRYTNDMTANYHNSVDYYILVYMLVNFYKVWAPLYSVLSSKHIKTQPRILELGPGPGTSTFSLVYFYAHLAKENPGIKFSLDYHAYEKEKKFLPLLSYFAESYALSAESSNYQVRFNFQNKDIYADSDNMFDEGKYDLILESNVLNGNENFQEENVKKLVGRCLNSLNDGGMLVLIEPADKTSIMMFKQIRRFVVNDFIYCDAYQEKKRVSVEGISLLRDVKTLGLRSDKQDSHWFSYAVFRKECVVQ